MEIHVVLPREAPALSALMARLFRETYTGLVPASDLEAHVASAFQPQVQAQELAQAGSAVLVAKDGAAWRGYAHLRPAPPPCPLPWPADLELARFYMEARQHGTGASQQLMAAALAWARGQGSDALWLQVWDANPRAIRFYLRQGYQDCGETTFQVGQVQYCDRVMAHSLR